MLWTPESIRPLKIVEMLFNALGWEFLNTPALADSRHSWKTRRYQVYRVYILDILPI